MNSLDYEKEIKAKFPGAMVKVTESGACTWIHVCIADRAFALQVTQTLGIGLSEVDLTQDLDISGHDEVVTEWDEALELLSRKLKMM